MAIAIRLIGILPRCGSLSSPQFQSATARLARSFATRPHPELRCTRSLTTPACQPRQRVNWRLLWRQNCGQTLERPASTSAKPTQPAKPDAASASKTGRLQRLAYPEKVLIYHSGTGKMTFLAMLKLTTIFVFIFFNFLAAPAYIQSDDHSVYETAGIIACGVIPLLYVGYSASPFVSAVHLHVPPFARGSTEMLKRFAASAPPSTKLDVVTMSLIGKPRNNTMTVGDLRPTNKRFGMVNYTRDVTAINKERKWWHFRAVRDFNIQEKNEGTIKNGWVWKELDACIKRRSEKKA